MRFRIGIRVLGFRFVQEVAVRSVFALLLVLTVGVLAGSAQQSVPFQGGIPVAPRGLAGKPLPAGPMVFDTGEGERIRVVAVTQELVYPYSMAWLPDGSMLITERFGNLRILRNGKLDPNP